MTDITEQSRINESAAKVIRELIHKEVGDEACDFRVDRKAGGKKTASIIDLQESIKSLTMTKDGQKNEEGLRILMDILHENYHRVKGVIRSKIHAALNRNGMFNRDGDNGIGESRGNEVYRKLFEEVNYRANLSR